jgi:hypothetical protein
VSDRINDWYDFPKQVEFLKAVYAREPGEFHSVRETILMKLDKLEVSNEN